MERGNTNSLLHEGFQEDEEKLNGVKAQMALLAGEGRSEGESGQGQPGSGATATEGKGRELNGDGPSAAAAAADLTDNCKQKDQGARGSGQESDKQPMEPAPKDEEGAEDVMHGPVLKSRLQFVSLRIRHPCFQCKITPWKLRELQRIFKENHFLSGLERDGFTIGENKTGDVRGFKHSKATFLLPGTSFSEDFGGDLSTAQAPNKDNLFFDQ